MKLVYDLIAAQPEGSSPVSGGGEYAVRIFMALCSHIQNNPAEPLVLYAIYDERKPIADELLKNAHSFCKAVYAVNELSEVPGLLTEVEADRFFSALPMRFRILQLPQNCEFIYTIHGLRPLELPWDSMEPHYFYSVRSVLRHLIPRCLGKHYIRARQRDFEQLFRSAHRQQIVTVSTHSRFALLAMFPHTQEVPVHTFYSPPSDSGNKGQHAASGSILDRLDLAARDYYLIISANRWGKNSYRLIRAFKKLLQHKLVKRQIVVLGKGRARFLKRLDHNRNFIVCDYVSRTELEELYKNAYAFVFPTLNEGFGYPPLECMQYGTPVLASAVNSLPEILEDAYLPLDPRSDIELASRVLRIENEADLWNALSVKARAQYEKIHAKQVSDRNDLIQLLTS